MNKVYKVIWNKAKHCYEVVSELAKSQGKSAQDKRMSRISMRAAAVLAAFLVTMGGGTINFVQAADVTASAQTKVEQKDTKATTPLTADELKKQLDKAGIKAGNVENSANVISIGTKSSVTFDKYYGDANHDGKIDVPGIGPWNAIAIGQSATVKNSANAIGIGGGAGGGETVVDNSLAAIAIGTHSQIKDSQQASAYGIDSAVTNSAGGTSYGAGSKITDSKLATAVGYATNVANSPQGVAIGQRSSVTNSTQSVAIGSYSQVYNKSNNSVALGAFSTVNGESGVISVGHKATDLYPLDSTGKSTYGSDFFRRVINVADGKDAHDAATVGQLNGYVAYDKNGENVNKNSVSFGGVNGSGTELKNVSGLTFKGPNNNMVLTGTAGGKAQVKNAGNSIVLSTLGGGAGQNRPQTTISDTNETISIGNSNTVTVDKNSDTYKNNKPYWFNGNVAVGTNVELTNAGESVGLGSSTEVSDSIASTAVGYGSSVKKSTFSAGFGDHSKVDNGTFSTAIGAYSEVKNAIGSVALGAHTSVDGQDNVVSVGNAANESYKRIVNMADGKDAHDAATVGQVKNGYVAYDTNKEGSVNPGSVTFTGVTKKIDEKDVNSKEVNVGMKLNNVNDISFNVPVYETEADKYAPKADPSIGSYGLITETGKLAGYESRSLTGAGLLPGKVSGDNSKGYNVALGRATSIDGANAGAIAVGKDATIVFDDNFSTIPNKGTESKTDSISIGTRTKNYNSYSGVALGASSGVWQSNWGTALGTDSHVDNSYYGTALGVYAKVQDAPEGVAIGRSAYVIKGGEGSVALGSQSVADEANVISVGHTATDLKRDNKPYKNTLTRRIINVANGTIDKDSHDAVTGGQLYDVKATAEKGFNVAIAQPDGKAQTHTYKPGETVTITGKNDNILAGVDDKGDINVSLNDNIKVKSVTTDDVILGGNSFAQAGIKAGHAEGATDDTYSLALGEGSSIVDLDGNARINSVAVGVGANVQQDNSTAIGTNATNNGNFSTSVGEDAAGSGDYATALGGLSYADINGTAVGTHAHAEENSVALGADSIANDKDVVSVGHAKGDTYTVFDDNGDLIDKTYDDDLNRKIVHVEDGSIAENSHEAVTGGQLYPIKTYTDALQAAGVVGGKVGGGENNLALGTNSFAFGNNATAVGYNSNAWKDNSVAYGANSSANGEGSVVIGFSANTYGKNSIALGKGAQVLTEGAENGIAIGNEAQNYGKNSIALGNSTQVFADNSVALGSGSIANKANTISVGSAGNERKVVNVADGTDDHDVATYGQVKGAIALVGRNSNDDTNLAVGKDSFTASYWDEDAEKFGDSHNTAIGVKAQISASSSQNSTAVGHNAIVSDGTNATAIGQNAYVGIDNGTAIGQGATVSQWFSKEGSVALGQGSFIGSGDKYYDTDTHGVVSIGKSGTDGFTRRIINVADGVDPHDAATVGQISKITGTNDKQGAVVQYDKKADKTTDYSSVTLQGTNGTALKNVSDIELGGKSFVAAGLVPGEVNGKSYATAIGNGSSVQDGYGTAIGAGAKSVGSQSTAIGVSAKTAGSMNSTAIGGTSQANASGATAVGAQSNVSYSSENGSAFGANSHVYAKNGTALGNGSWAFGDDSVALGYNSRTQVDEKGVVSVGNTESNLTRRIINVTDGTLAKDSHDAVTGSQLYATNQTIGDISKFEKVGLTDKDDEPFDNVTDAIVDNKKNINYFQKRFNQYGSAGVIVEEGSSAGPNSLQLGNKTFAPTKESIAIGPLASIYSDAKDKNKNANSTTIGVYSFVNGHDSTALGHNAHAWGDNTTVIGADGESTGSAENPVKNNTVIGAQAKTQGVSNATALGQSATVKSQFGTALGAGASIGGTLNNQDAKSSTAVGYLSKVADGAYNSTVVGQGATANVANSTVVGAGSSAGAGSSVIVGSGVQTLTGSDNTTAVGADVQIQGAKDGVALGKGAQISYVNNAVALGAGSIADEANTVSVGSAGNERKITNVADGVNDFDAVNKKQLNAVDTKVTGLSDSAVQYDKNAVGTTDFSSVTLKGEKGTALKNVSDIVFTDEVPSYPGADPDDTKLVNLSFRDAGLLPGTIDTEAADKSTAIGKDSNISGSSTGSTVIGYGANVYGGVQDATAIGKGASIGNNSILNGSVALGAGSTVSNAAAGLPDIITGDDHGVVSVGNSSPYNRFTRRIINVTDGRIMEGSHDAVTGQQLYAEQKNRTDADQVFTDKFAAYENAGIIAGTIENKNPGGYMINLGKGSQILGKGVDSVLVGSMSKVQNSTYTGGNTLLGSKSSITAPQYTGSGNSNSTAIGYKVKIENEGNGTAVGANTQVLANYGTALGVNAKVNQSKNYGVALGANSVVDSWNSVALGSGSEVTDKDKLSTDNSNGIVSVGKSGDKGFTRRIINVADGVNDFDAVNKKQLNAVDTKVTGLANNAVQYDSADKSSVTFGGSNGTVLKNVADIALPGYKGHYSTFVGSGLVNGVVYDTTSDSQWTENGSEKTGSIAIGRGSNVRGTSGLAVGIGATVGTGDNSTVIANGTALGSNAIAGGQNGTAVGEEANVAGDNGAAFGYQAKADVDSTAIGTNATAGYNGAGESVAIGKDANVQYAQGAAVGNKTEIMADQGTALGYGAQITWNGKNSVALGAGSIANEEDVVSVGRAAGQGGNISNPAITRRIVNVADGKDSTDAATVGQLDAKVKGASSKVEAKDKNITVESKTDENGTIYTVGLSNNLDLTNEGSIAFGTTGLKLDGKGLTINNVTYVSDEGLNAGGKTITGVGTPVNGTDAANKDYVDNSIKNAGISKDPTSGDVTIGGADGAGKVTVNKDGSASLAGTKGNGFTANADGSNTISGDTKFTGNVTINNQQIATGADVSGIQKQIGYDEKTKTYTKIDNGATTVIDGINKNTAAIKTNTDNIGATGKDGKLSLDNKATTVEAGINKNTADIANNAAAIQQNQESIATLGGAVNKLDTRVDRVGAGAAALAALHPLDYDPANKWDFAAGYGHYKGANAVSIGTYYRPNENTLFSVGGSFGGGENMVNAGVSFKLGGGSGVTTSRTAMAAEINSLKDSNKALADNNKVLTDKVAAQDKKLADYDQKMKDMEAKLEALLKAQKQ